MAGKRITSGDVARLAGVSRTTVSFVLNDVTSAKISADTRERVLHAAAELGYVPDAAARTLASGKTSNLGLIVDRSDRIRVDTFFPQVLQGLHDVCREQGYRLLIETAEFADGNGTYGRLVRAKQIDGLVVLDPRADDTELRALIESDYPVVLIGVATNAVAYSVNTEDLSTPSGTWYATRHLLGLGHTRIAFIHYRPQNHPSGDPRLTGYVRALADAGIPDDPALVRHGQYSAESGYIEMAALLELPDRPTALVAGNDAIAIGAMAAIHESGLRIPEDIAVVGHDDIPMARFTTPALTTIRVPAYDMAVRCGEMIVQLMAGDIPPVRQVIMPNELIVRRSCGVGTTPIPGSEPTAAMSEATST